MSRTWRSWLAPATTAGAVALTLWWSVDRGRSLQRRTPHVNLGAAPLVGRDPGDSWQWRFGISLVGAAIVVGAVVALQRSAWWAAARLRLVAGVAGLATMAFAVCLALVDGNDGLLYGITHPSEYLANLARTPPAGEFVSGFFERLPTYTVHVRGHPPGYTLVLKALAGVGLGGPWAVVAMTVAATGLTAAAATVVVHRVGGAPLARRVVPLLAVSPYAIWMVSSADAVFAATAATGTALVAYAVERTGRRAALLGVAGGLSLGWLMIMTYLGATFLAVPGMLVLAALWRRRTAALTGAAAAVAGLVAVLIGFGAAGFWWPRGVDATHSQYVTGTAKFRPFDYFVVGNLGAALLAVGPLAAVALAALRNRRAWLLAGAALVALAVAHLSTYTKAEVERIWLPFFPWIVVGAAAALSSRRWFTALVVAQGVTAIVLQAALVQKW